MLKESCIQARCSFMSKKCYQADPCTNCIPHLPWRMIVHRRMKMGMLHQKNGLSMIIVAKPANPVFVLFYVSVCVWRARGVFYLSLNPVSSLNLEPAGLEDKSCATGRLSGGSRNPCAKPSKMRGTCLGLGGFGDGGPPRASVLSKPPRQVPLNRAR